MELTINQIAEATKGRLVYVGPEGGEAALRETKADSVVLDSRLVTAGGVFVATVGERVDGHSFVASVFEKGAVLAVVQKVPETATGSYLLVEDTLQALKDIAECYRRSLSIPVVGITGSVGKTSTKEFIATVLAEKYTVLKTEGNYNNEIGVPLTLLRIRPEHEVAVVEMGISDFGEMHRLSKMARPDIAVITNIGRCHLENLKDRDGVLRAKTEIFDFMAENGTVCLNGEDDKLCTVTAPAGRRLFRFGFSSKEEGLVTASDVESKGLWGSTATFCTAAGECFPAEITLPGQHMVLNGLAATCVAEQLGLTTEQIRAGLKKVAAVGGRNNLIRTERFTLIDDCYNANPVSMKAGIDLLCMAEGTKVAILGDMFELGENSDAMHAEVGSYGVEKELDFLLCVGENSRHMYEAALRDKKESKVDYFETRDALLAALEEKTLELPAGSTVLIKASHGMKFSRVVEFFTTA